MNKSTIPLLLLLVSFPALQSASAQNLPGWALVWSDEFSQPDGSSPDPTKWNFDTGGGGWGNNELEYYTSRTNNARIQGGQLVIEARQELFSGYNYTSARMLTRGKWSWTYGRMEARIQLPRGQGLWPAFWMMGTNFASVGWPTCGEIDIMENIGSEPGIVHGTIHGPGYSGANGIGGPYTLPGNAAFADAFHIFALEWQTNRIRWYVDGQEYFTVSPASLPNGTTWVYTAPDFLLLNVAVGGNWPGSPNTSTTFPQRMTVDYVRVYAATNPPTTNGPGCRLNVLSNPGFESAGLSTWTTYGTPAFNTLLESSNSVPVHSGSNAFKLFGQFTGGDNYSGAFYDTPTVPGTAYTAGGWALTQIADKIAVSNSAWLEVSFRDPAANMLALYRSATITSTTPAGIWRSLPITNQFDPATFAFIGTVSNLLAPVGCAFVRYQVVFHQPQTAAGSVLFDDLNLYLSGETEVPVSTTAAKAANNLNLSFPTTSASAYQVRYKTNLANPNWLVLTNITGSGGMDLISDPLNTGQRFYRVVQICN